MEKESKAVDIVLLCCVNLLLCCMGAKNWMSGVNLAAQLDVWDEFGCATTLGWVVQSRVKLTQG